MLRRLLFVALGLLCLSAAHAQPGSPTNNPGGSGAAVSITAGSACLTASPSPLTGTGTLDITGSIASGACGGTGVANTGKTITLGGNLTTSGAFGLTWTLTGTTALTLPTAGTLAILGANTFTAAQTISPTNPAIIFPAGFPVVQTPTIGFVTASDGTHEFLYAQPSYILIGTNVASAAVALAFTADGVGTLGNQAQTGFGRLNFGGATSSFPALKRSAAILQSRLGDDSGDADLQARLLITAGFTVAGLPAAATAGRRAYVTDQLTTCAAMGAALTGGGAVKCPVFDNGAAWVGG